MVAISVTASNATEIERLRNVLCGQGLQQVGSTKNRDFYVRAKFQGNLAETMTKNSRNSSGRSRSDDKNKENSNSRTAKRLRKNQERYNHKYMEG